MTSEVATVKTEKQPAGLYVLFLTEMWERFSYYAMRGILVLYLIKVMQFSESHARCSFRNLTPAKFMAQ